MRWLKPKPSFLVKLEQGVRLRRSDLPVLKQYWADQAWYENFGVPIGGRDELPAKMVERYELIMQWEESERQAAERRQSAQR